MDKSGSVVYHSIAITTYLYYGDCTRFKPSESNTYQ